jgi:hypothetical protein
MQLGLTVFFKPPCFLSLGSRGVIRPTSKWREKSLLDVMKNT